MSQPGYVYALINPSLEGLVKLGKTTSDPETRAKELSTATGVPTPFYVAYEIYVGDCSWAEQQLHSLLALKGYRVAENREFFRASLNEVIRLMQQVERTPVPAEMGLTTEPCLDSDQITDPNESSDHDFRERAIRQLEKRGDAYSYGHGDTLQDHQEAMRCYQQAAKLGSGYACCQLGNMYEMGEGCDVDPDKALAYFRESARLGWGEAYKHMAYFYAEKGHTENFWKCWTMYFKSATFQTAPDRVKQAYDFLVCDHKIEQLSPDFLRVFSSLKSELIEFIELLIGRVSRETAKDFLKDIEKIEKYL